MNDKNGTKTTDTGLDYIASLFKPIAKKQTGRKVWSIDLQTTWIPFFTASNTMGVTSIPHEAIGYPVRLAYSADGAVRFNKSGRPVFRVAKELNDSVRLVRDNFVAGLESFAHMVATEHEADYNATFTACLEAGKPIAEHDKTKLNEAIEKAVQLAVNEAGAETNNDNGTKTNRELVTA